MFGETGGGKGGLKNGVVEHNGALAGRLELTPVEEANKDDDEDGNKPALVLVGSALVVSMMSVRITT